MRAQLIFLLILDELNRIKLNEKRSPVLMRFIPLRFFDARRTTMGFSRGQS